MAGGGPYASWRDGKMPITRTHNIFQSALSERLRTMFFSIKTKQLDHESSANQRNVPPSIVETAAVGPKKDSFS
jgi:hypothetical protein